nr:MAG TPA: hypothetical protein [Caudoviricetes sp.]
MYQTQNFGRDCVMLLGLTVTAITVSLFSFNFVFIIHLYFQKDKVFLFQTCLFLRYSENIHLNASESLYNHFVV